VGRKALNFWLSPSTWREKIPLVLLSGGTHGEKRAFPGTKARSSPGGERRKKRGGKKKKGGKERVSSNFSLGENVLIRRSSGGEEKRKRGRCAKKNISLQEVCHECFLGRVERGKGVMAAVELGALP